MSLYSSSGPSSNVLKGSRTMSDGTGTINPATLNGVVLNSQAISDSTPRGLKRSRSPEEYNEYVQPEFHDEHKPRKRGRPAKTPRTSGDYTNDQAGTLPTPSSQASPGLVNTPIVKGQALQNAVTPTQPSPGPRATPKSTLKALPTVRDHTSDQLGPGGDEYIPREYDDQGEQKANDMGYLQGGREYKIRTFRLPGRGEKLFMLATECARTLQYRDSYLLFNKNRSLFKIIASPKEKEELVAQDILPYSYRSRQIALVTARSMFRQFGSRVVKDGRRVRDDYWEAKARKQGFTEDDPAGEKRPGAARAREEAAAAAAQGHRHLTQMYGNIVYANDTNGNYPTPTLPPGINNNLPQMSMYEPYEAKYRDVRRPPMENVGPIYNDLTRTVTEAEMVSQASHAADHSKLLNSGSQFRRGIVSDYWHRPHDPPPVSTPPQTHVEPAIASLPSPSYDNPDPIEQAQMAMPSQRVSQTPMNPPATFANPHNPMHSPSRPAFQAPGHPSSIPRQPSNLSNVQTPSQGIPGNYYSQIAQQQGWGQPPPQPSPSPSMSNRMYNQPNASSPHMPQNSIQSPMHSQSPHPQQQQQMANPQFQQQMQAGNMGGAQLFGPGAGLRAMNAGGYNPMNMNAQMYNQMAAQNYMQQQQQQQQQHHGGQPQQNMYGQQWQGFH